jgi:hypothetical protein
MNFFYQSLAVSLKPVEGEEIWGLALDAKIDEHGGSQNSYFVI